MTNVLFSADTIRTHGRIFALLNDARIAMVDRRDVAAVAALALSEDGHDGRAYVLTGPEAITFHDVAAQLSIALGTTVEFVDVPDEAAIHAALQAGAPEWLAHGVVEVDRLLRSGLNAETTDVLRVLLGREPFGFADFARDVAHMLRPSSPLPTRH
jgi:uncharacterized protein YbjT (DUF2867 family)